MLTARILTTDDAPNLRQLRLEYLHLPKFRGIYNNLLEKEADAPTNYWNDLATPTDTRAWFGLFNGRTQIGINYGRLWEEDESGKSVFGGGAYVRPEWSGRGFSAPLYIERNRWAYEKGFRRIVVFLFDKDVRSIEMWQRQGAEHLFSRMRQHPGCRDCLVHYYALELGASRPLARRPETTQASAPIAA